MARRSGPLWTKIQIMDFSSLVLALGASLTAGWNLYLTVLTLGLLDFWDLLSLPPDLEVLSHPWVLVTAGVLALIEFVTDKIPYLDNTWDAVHSFIRVPAGALLAAGALGGLPPHLLWVAGLAGGFVTLTSHGAKASARLAVNASPEPFTNWFLSLVEDLLSISLLWLVSQYPYLALAALLAVLALCLFLLALFYRLLAGLFLRRRQHLAGSRELP